MSRNRNRNRISEGCKFFLCIGGFGAVCTAFTLYLYFHDRINRAADVSRVCGLNAAHNSTAGIVDAWCQANATSVAHDCVRTCLFLHYGHLMADLSVYAVAVLVIIAVVIARAKADKVLCFSGDSSTARDEWGSGGEASSLMRQGSSSHGRYRTGSI